MSSPGRVLVVGDANPDLVLRGDVRPRFGQAEQLLTDTELVLGGSAGITACAFARLGRPVGLAAAIGRDVFADRVVAELTSAGVDVSGLVVRPGVPTGLTVVLSDGDDRGILTSPGAIPTLRAADVLPLLDRPGLVHVHVASLFLLPPLAAELPELLAAARAHGLTTSLDTNADPTGAWQGVDPLLPHLDVLLPNRGEVVGLGRDADAHAAAVRLAAAGPLVVVKDGADGAWAVDASGTRTAVAGTPVEAVDTTGAGDTFDAAFLDAWLAGRALAECLARATRAGALAVGAVGGTAGQPTSDQLDPAPLHARKDP